MGLLGGVFFRELENRAVLARVPGANPSTSATQSQLQRNFGSLGLKGGTKAGLSRHLLHEADQRRQDVGCGSVQATSHPMKKSSSTVALVA